MEDVCTAHTTRLCIVLVLKLKAQTTAKPGITGASTAQRLRNGDVGRCHFQTDRFTQAPIQHNVNKAWLLGDYRRDILRPASSWAAMADGMFSRHLR